MGKGILPRDENSLAAVGAVGVADDQHIYPLVIDEVTDRLLVTAIITGGVALGASASAGAGTSHFRKTDLTNTAAAIKATAGKLHGYNLYNANASLAFVHFYNVVAASVVVGTTTPLRSIALPSTSNGTIAIDKSDPIGIAFSTAISIAATTGVDNGTAPGIAIIANVEFI